MLRRYLIPILGTLYCLGFTHLAIAQERVLGVVPQGAAQALALQWQPVLNYLQEPIGHPIRFATASTISRFERRVLKGEFDYVYVNPLLYLRARKEAGYRALVRRSNPLRGIVVVAKSSGKRLSDLSGATIAFPSPTALGATILTRAELDRRKIKYFVNYVGTHESGYQGVMVGRYAAAGGVRRSFNVLPEETRKKLSVLLESRPVSGHVIAVHPRVGKQEAATLQKLLLTLHEDRRQLMDDLKLSRFVRSNTSDFRSLSGLKPPPIRQLTKMRFHVIPRLNQRDTLRQMSPLVSHIRQNLELDLELKTYKTMSAFDRAINSETGPSLINANPLQAIKLVDRKYTIIAQQTPVDSPEGMYGLILVNKNSQIKNVSDLKNKRIAFGGNRKAFFASVVPRVLLARNGLHGKYIDASRPGAVADVIRRLHAGEIDAAGAGAMAVNSEILKKKYAIQEMPVLLASEAMPGLAWLVSANVPDDIRNELRDELLHFGPSAAGHKAMTSAGIARLKPASRESYAPILKYLEEDSRLQ